MAARVVAGLALALVVGCRGSCHDIGCVSMVSVTVDQAGERPLVACVGDACSPPNELTIVNIQLDDPTEVVVRVAGGGAEVARASAVPVKWRPNGEGCPPECRTVRLRLTVDDKLVPL